MLRFQANARLLDRCLAAAVGNEGDLCTALLFDDRLRNNLAGSVELAREAVHITLPVLRLFGIRGLIRMTGAAGEESSFGVRSAGHGTVGNAVAVHVDALVVDLVGVPVEHHVHGRAGAGHQPVAEGACLACHGAHAAKEKGLLVGGAPDTFLGGGLQTARQALDEGRIGEPVAASAQFLGRGMEMWHPDPYFFFQPGAGPLLDVGPYYLTALASMLGPRTRVVAFNHVSNALGTINPVSEIAALIRSKCGALIVCDGAQAVPHLSVRFDELGVDCYAFSGHKMCGPMGIGALAGRRALLEAMPPYQMGGDMIEYVHDTHSTWNVLPHKFEAGTPNVAGAIGLAAAADYLESIGHEALWSHEQELILPAFLLADGRSVEQVDRIVADGGKGY